MITLIVILLVVLVLLPLYVYILSKANTLGQISAYETAINKEEEDEKEQRK